MNRSLQYSLFAAGAIRKRCAELWIGASGGLECLADDEKQGNQFRLVRRVGLCFVALFRILMFMLSQQILINRNKHEVCRDLKLEPRCRENLEGSAVDHTLTESEYCSDDCYLQSSSRWWSSYTQQAASLFSLGRRIVRSGIIEATQGRQFDPPRSALLCVNHVSWLYRAGANSIKQFRSPAIHNSPNLWGLGGGGTLRNFPNFRPSTASEIFRSTALSDIHALACSRASRCASYRCASTARLSVVSPSAMAAFAAPATAPWRPRAAHARRCNARPPVALADGATVAVVGATGGVGRLVVARLLAAGRYRVRAVARDAAAATTVLGDDAALEVAAAEVVDGGEPLEDALRGAAAVVVATGTTAFPTRAWGPRFRNSPDRVDRVGSENVVRCLDREVVERVVYVSSIGTLRRRSGFFALLNLCGVLDAKRAAEVAVVEAAKEAGYTYGVVRPGRLAGGPYTNRAEFGLKDLGEAMQALRVEPGDSVLGDVTRKSVADAVCYTLDFPESVDYAVVNVAGGPPSREEFEARLSAVSV